MPDNKPGAFQPDPNHHNRPRPMTRGNIIAPNKRTRREVHRIPPASRRRAPGGK